MVEIWKDIKDYEGLYQVSNLGRVKSLQRYCYCGNKYRLKKEKILNGSTDKDGYIRVGLYNNGQCVLKKIHRLVATAFIPNSDNFPQVNHKDENKTNNFVYINEDGLVNLEKSNLEWCSPIYNTNYGTAIERRSSKKRKSVKQFSLDGVLIKIWESVRKCESEGFSHQGVSSCCKGIFKTYKGFIWNFANT